MGSIRSIAVVLAILVGFTSCSRDPNVVKKRYLESGNKYFEKGRYKEASIQYRNALKRDPKFGEAHYKLGLVALKVNNIQDAVGSFRRAIELIRPDQPDHWEAVVHLTEIYLAVARGEKQYMDEVEKFTGELLKRDPNSFDAHRLIGDLPLTPSVTSKSDQPSPSTSLHSAPVTNPTSRSPGATASVTSSNLPARFASSALFGAKG